MAGHPGLNRSFGALAAAVLLAHALAIDWVAEHLRAAPPSQLHAMAPVMYTRMLQPVAAVRPPPHAAVSRPRAVKKAVAKARTSAPTAPVQVEAAVATAAATAASAPEPEPPVPPVPEVMPPLPVQTASAPSAPEPAPLPDTWPIDTRLNYGLSGQFRSGPLFGEAKVAWQRDQARYQVKVEVDVTLWLHWTMTSQGEVGPEGLLPRVYEEERRGKRRSVRVEDGVVRYEGGRSHPRPTGVQDTASQFIELGHRFAQGTTPLEVGRTVDVWLARPGGVDLWTYDVVGLEPLALDNLGTVPAFHLKPRPIANSRGNITAEIWFAPTLQYLPVRIRINTAEADYLDLAVRAIEQR